MVGATAGMELRDLNDGDRSDDDELLVPGDAASGGGDGTQQQQSNIRNKAAAGGGGGQSSAMGVVLEKYIQFAVEWPASTALAMLAFWVVLGIIGFTAYPTTGRWVRLFGWLVGWLVMNEPPRPAPRAPHHLPRARARPRPRPRCQQARSCARAHARARALEPRIPQPHAHSLTSAPHPPPSPRIRGCVGQA